MMLSRHLLSLVGLGLIAGLWMTIAESAAQTPTYPLSSTDCEHLRAGNPLAIAPWAVRSDTGHYVGYLIGGGNPYPHKADAPSAHEGTWGWDYRGWLLPRRIMLGWWHDRREQGGTGAYKTDGPHIPPYREGGGSEHE